MQKNLLNSSSIRLQIAKGGTNDLQLHLNPYRMSVVDINRGQNRVKVSENLGQLEGRRNKK